MRLQHELRSFRPASERYVGLPAAQAFLVAVSMVATASTLAADYPSFTKEHVGAEIDPESSPVAWSDEFDTLRASIAGQGDGPWFPGVHTLLVPGEKMALVPDSAYQIEGGVLRMSTRVDPVDGKRVEAHLETQDGRGKSVAFQNGYFEARMWLPRALGSHAGLWLLSEEKGAGHAEVDVVESYGVGDYAVHSSTHIWPVNRSNHASKSNYSRQSDIYEGYHTYGVLALDDEFRFYYDRKEIGRIARIPEQRVPLYMLLSVFGNPTQPVIEQPALMLVDYMRVYAMTAPNPPADVGIR